MQLFDQLFDIIHDKQTKLAEDLEDENEFQPYLIQRWLSMYSPLFAKLLNSSTNVLWKALDDKQIWYKMFSAVIPQSQRKKIVYIKKDQQKKKQLKIDREVVKLLADNLELSQREVEIYLDMSNTDIKKLKKQMGIETDANRQ